MSSLIQKKICRLLCILCKRYLSRTPLCVIQNGKTICGRCVPPDGALRELLLEKLLENKQFPCIFDKNGCMMTNKSNQSAEHERWCKYREMLCPLSLTVNCETIVIATDVLDHIWEHHKGYIFGSPAKFLCNTNNENEHRFVLFYNAELFVISLTVCRETTIVRHELVGINFQFDPKKYGYIFEESPPSNVLQQLDDGGNEPDETEPQYITAVCTMVGKADSQELHYRIKCANCERMTKPFYSHDTRKGFLCYACSSSKVICIYNMLGCVHRDRDGNLDKHTLYFCAHALHCPICNDPLTDKYIIDHYTLEHLNITYQDKTQFTFSPKSQTEGWFLIDSRIGKVLCRYSITSSSFSLRMHSRLRSDELNYYKCHILIGNPNMDVGHLPIAKQLETRYSSVFDWGIDFGGELFRQIFKNGMCKIKTDIAKRAGLTNGEWLDDLFQTVNETDQLIIVE